jgi:hypothetical protein
VPQIGDNDSGRFVKAMPEYSKVRDFVAQNRFANAVEEQMPISDQNTIFAEDHLSHQHLVAAIYGLFSRPDFVGFCGENQIDTLLIRSLTNQTKLTSCQTISEKTNSTMKTIGTEQDIYNIERRLKKLSGYEKRVTVFDVTGLSDESLSLTHRLKTYAYSEFGLYIFRSPRFFLAIRCGPRGRNGQGGHDHNDQLAIELWIDGMDWVTDSGTYVYSALPKRRNQYRSVTAHFAPHIGDQEPSPLDKGLFILPDHTKAKTLYFGLKGFLGVHYGFIIPTYRIILLDNSQVIMTDYIPKANANIKSETTVIQNPIKSDVAFSPGYGMLVVPEPD